MKFKIGDRVENTDPDCKVPLGATGTVLENSDTPFVEWDIHVGGHSAGGRGKQGHCWASLEEDLKLVSSSNNKKTMKDVIGAIAKRLLDSDTKTLVKAGFIDSNLELTDKGTAALNAIVFEQNKAALVDAATAEIEEAKQ